jgi:hypothetical protein
MRILRSASIHVFQAVLEGALVAALIVVLVAGTALAAKGGNSGTSGHKGGGTTNGTIAIVLLDSTDGQAHFGQKVTFTVSTSATSKPWVTVKCYQSTLVYQASNGIFATSLNQVFTLGPTPAWQGGEAACTAWLQDWDSYAKNGKITNLASLDFHAYP